VTPDPCMRWSPGRRQSWRRVSEGGFDRRNYGVTTLDEIPARDWVLARHYSGSWVNAKLRYGLFDLTAPAARLAGVAVLSIPVGNKVLTNVFPHLVPNKQSLELGRFVLEDAALANAETWFLKEVFRLALAAGIRGIVSFSDPVPRYAGGRLVMPGHVGIIYQAKGAHYLSRATPRTLAVFPDGQVMNAKTMQKIRDQDQGHEYAERQLVDRGARAMRPGDKPAKWLAGALDDAGAWRVRHRGVHRYAWANGRNQAQRDAVVMAMKPQPYPKIPDLDSIARAA
jgi:hypothetical protein